MNGERNPRALVLRLPRPARDVLGPRARRALTGLLAATVGAGLLVPAATGAAATPGDRSRPFSASTTASAAVVDADLLGLVPLAGLAVAPASAQAGTLLPERTTARVGALSTTVLGGLTVPADLARQSGPQDNPAPATGGVDVDVAGLVGLGTVRGTANARWAGDSVCLPAATPLSRTVSESAKLVVPGLVEVGALRSTGESGLAGTGSARAVRSTVTTDPASVSLLDGAVRFTLPQQVVRATSTGTGTPEVSHAVSDVAVTAGGTTRTLRADGSELSLLLGAVKLRLNPVTRTSSGSTASASTAGLLDVRVVSGPATAHVRLYPLSVSATAPAGGVDCGLPAPRITDPAADQLRGTRALTVSGTADGAAGHRVTVVGDDVPLGTATVAADGTWTLPVLLGRDGPTRLTAVLDASGDRSPPSGAVTVTVDTLAPGVPGITTPTDLHVRTAGTTLQGTAEPSSLVRLLRPDGSELTTARTRPDGTWSVDVVLPAGRTALVAVAVDAAGNASGRSAEWVRTLDADAPQPPVVTAPLAPVSTDRPVVTGTAEPGADVLVEVGGQVLGPFRADGAGVWTLTWPAGTALPEGPTTLTATVVDRAGNVSAATAHTVVVDTRVPDAPEVLTPQDGADLPLAPTTVTGRGEPGATVRVLLDGTAVGTAVVDGTGHWVLGGLPADATGAHALEVAQTDRAQNTSPATRVGYTVTPPVLDPLAGLGVVALDPPDGAFPTTTARVSGRVLPWTATSTGTVRVRAVPAPGTTGAPVEAAGVPVAADGSLLVDLVLGDGTWSVTGTHEVAGAPGPTGAPVLVRVDTGAERAPEPPVFTDPAGGSTVDGTSAVLRGTAAPGARVELSGAAEGWTLADERGTWAIAVGPHTGGTTFTARAVSPYGKESAPVSLTVVFRPLPGAVTVDTPVAGTVTRDAPVAVSGAGVPGARVTVTSGTATDTVTAGPGGRWSAALDLADGLHVVTAVQTVGGPVSPPATTSVEVDRTAPGPLTVERPTAGTAVTSAVPDVSGTGAEPGARVVLRGADGTPLRETTADVTGAWEFPDVAVPAGTADGPVVWTVVQVDRAGNVSAPADVRFTVDTHQPPAPVITSPRDRAPAGDRTVTGTAAEDGTVEVLVDDLVVATTDVVDGAWTAQLPGTVGDGEHELRARLTSPLGTVSPLSAPVTLVLDTASPEPPVITGTARLVAGVVLDRDGTYPVSGSGEPGAALVLRDAGTSGVLGRTTVAADGTWTVRVRPGPATVLVELRTTVEAVQTDPTGNTSAPSASVTVLVLAIGTPSPDPTPDPTSPVPTDEPTPPVASPPVTSPPVTSPPTSAPPTSAPPVTSPPTSTPTPTVTVTVTPTATPTAPRRDPVLLHPLDGTTTGDPNVTVFGRGQPGAMVVVRDGTRVLGRIVTDAAGNFSLAPSAPFATGRHVLTAEQLEPTGPSRTSAASAVTVTAGGAVAPVITGPVDGTVTPKRRPTVSGHGQPGSTLTLRVDGAVVGTAVVGPAATGTTVGLWNVKLTEPLAAGPHRVVATQRTGSADVASNTTTLVVDAGSPVPVEITTPVDYSWVDEGDAITVTGTGEPGGRVSLRTNHEDDAPLTAVVRADGMWSVVGVPHAGGLTWVVALQDIAWRRGQTSAVAGARTQGGVRLLSAGAALLDGDPDDAPENRQSMSQTVRVLRADTGGSTAPVVQPVVITAPAEGQRVTDRRPAVSGTGHPGATVVVRDASGAALGVATAAADGTWSLVPSAHLPDGPVRLTATQVVEGPDGGTSRSGTRTITVLGAASPTDPAPAPTDPAAPPVTTPPTSGPPGTGAAPGAGAVGTSAPGAGAPVRGPVLPVTSVGRGTGGAGTATAGTATARTPATTAGAGGAATASRTPSRLARTGADLSVAVTGLALLVAGLGALLLARRGGSAPAAVAPAAARAAGPAPAPTGRDGDGRRRDRGPAPRRWHAEDALAGLDGLRAPGSRPAARPRAAGPRGGPRDRLPASGRRARQPVRPPRQSARSDSRGSIR
ncbi:Ig-like domain-containing protein [Kineococcus terrestris]|uniref:Ig-like domain-containing protein n=1 Tax=Kineococcus terrestris TaxID=2044856 RepID=UPI0034DB2722